MYGSARRLLEIKMREERQLKFYKIIELPAVLCGSEAQTSEAKGIT
jgi:hypothetical protein